jgi:hypothetical protein
MVTALAVGWIFMAFFAGGAGPLLAVGQIDYLYIYTSSL